MAIEPTHAVVLSMDESSMSDGVDTGTPKNIWLRVLQAAEHRPLWFLGIWVAAYVLALAPMATVPLWYDELLTYYGATATTFSRFYAGITHFDFNPPLLYGLVRLSVAGFGNSPLATRIPSMVSFLGASCLLFWYVRRRSGGSYALLSVGVFFSTGFFGYASEARPYALGLFFFTLAFVCWSSAASRADWSPAHTGLAAAGAGMVLSHCFAVPYLLSILAAELARSKESNCWRWNKRIWIALGVPFLLLTLYIPFFRQPGRILFPFVMIASAATWWEFYAQVLTANLAPIGLGIAAALLVPKPQAAPAKTVISTWQAVFVGTALLIPALVIAYAMHAQMPFVDRYGIWIALPVTLLIVRLVEYISAAAPAAGLLAALLTFVFFCSSHIQLSGVSVLRSQKPSDWLAHIPPEVPIIAGSGAGFLQLGHEQPANVVSRLYYLTDHQAAAQYAHSTVYEDFGIIKQAYPVKGSVEPYEEFLTTHKHFVLVALPNDPQCWILPKLKADGASVQSFAGQPFLFEVTVPPTVRTT